MASGQAASEIQNTPITTLPKRADFLRLRSGKKHGCKLFTLLAKPHPERDCGIRVGLTVTTKTGSAVERNRMKRRLRSAVREVFSVKGGLGYDYVIIARRPTLRAEFSKLTNELALALDHVHGNGAKGSQRPAG